MATEREQLTDRVRAALADERTTREVSMFGGRSFMVNGAMVVAARGEDLLVRIDPGRSGELLARPGAEQAEMGAGRSMGPRWITFSGKAIGSDEELFWWIGVGLDHNATTARRTR